MLGRSRSKHLGPRMNQTIATKEAPPPGAATASSTPSLALSWKHPAGLVGLSLVNLGLNILTLGAYSFWGRTEVRKRIWSAIRIGGEPLQYTGTGGELFKGFLIVFLALIVPTILVSAAAAVLLGPEHPALDAIQLVILVLFFFLAGLASYSSQRYRLSRTRWRGIRGALVGSATSYAVTYFWTGIAALVTLGWLLPWRSTRLQADITKDMRFGSAPFTFTATAGPLYARFAVLWVVVATCVAGLILLFMGGIASLEALKAQATDPDVTAVALTFLAVFYLGLFLVYVVYAVLNAWYRSSQIRHFAAHTEIAGATFNCTVTARGLIWIAVSNLAIVILSLGVLTPVALARSTRYMTENLALVGELAPGAILQTADQDLKRGDGLAHAFDLDGF